MITPDRSKLSRRSFTQFIAGAAAIGLIESPRAAMILGRESNRLSWRAHRTALMAAPYEDLRALAGSWRWVHRWMALLMVLLVVLHVVYALAYNAFWFDEGFKDLPITAEMLE